MNLDPKIHARVPFGAYCEVHNEPSPTNSMQPRTHAMISFLTCGNIQVSVYSLCVTMEIVLKCCLFTKLPMPDFIVKLIEKMAALEGMPEGLEFLNRQMESYEFEGDKNDILLMDQTTKACQETPAEIPVVEI